MRTLAEGNDFTQEQILKIASEKESWEKFFSNYTSQITFDLFIGAFEVDLIKVYIHNGKGSCIENIYDFGISEFLLGCTYIKGSEINS